MIGTFAESQELSDELVAIGETIIDQFAEEVGPDKANEAFHEWNDIVYDICFKAMDRDRDGKGTVPSPSQDPHGFLAWAEQRDYIRREETIEGLVERCYNLWRDQRSRADVYGNTYLPTVALQGPTPGYIGSNTAPAQASFQTISPNIPPRCTDREARFLIEAQVREAFENRL